MILDRRNLLKSIVGVPLIAIAPGAKALATKDKHYLLFFDRDTVNIDELASREFPQLPNGFVMELIPVRLRAGQTIDDAIKVYGTEE